MGKLNTLYAFISALLYLQFGLAEEQQYNCPNEGKPKLDAYQKPIQCLPGQSSELVCGKGYSCFFSGGNYKCCPTNEDDYDEVTNDAECPDGSFIVLNSKGAPLKCLPRIKQCPRQGMFCNENALTPVCCENMQAKKAPSKVDGPRKETEKAQKPEARIQSPPTPIAEEPINTQPKDKVEIKHSEPVVLVVDRDIRGEGGCPQNAIRVSGKGGKPVMCTENGKCPQASMSCHKTNNVDAVCCQRVELIKEENVDDQADPAQNPLKYRQDETKKLVEELIFQEELEKQLASALENGSVVLGETLSDVPDAASNNVLDKDKDGEPRKPAESPRITEKQQERVQTPRPPQGSARAHAVKTATNDDDKSDDDSAESANVEYKVHNQGGYAISRKLDRINSRKPSAQQKLFAQEYLLDQIKNGWPYDERFYRTERIAVLNKGARPAAVVHFPN